ncbi:MAG TPA: type I restriction-modification enzyme R subunit C-terminal domain-containing protein, partial [Pyrinomonadaceae bacterium]|nr:type I restriction-modification enzyme R subunit C-terminal domain-containing protein [Pyrinomonadaceae bacterium]
REEFARFIPEGDVGKFTDTLAAELHKNFSGTMKILRDADFQNVMEHYDRASKTFVVAIDAEDTVESERLERYGKYEKAEDYLEAFAEFVKTNAASISALTILLTRPQDWQPNALRELCQKLKEGSFKTEDLQKAHARIYHKELADLISMVKHAADEQCILLTARERVERAIEAITAGKQFDADQTRWLGLIQEHLATNLTIDEEDFEYQSIFRNEGGKGKARKVFGAAELNNLLREINTAIAA